MANGQHGGYRQPSKPAPVSGPGALSRRTDGTPMDHFQALSAAPDQAYGAKTQQLNEQRIAPMGAAAPMPSPAQVPQGQGQAQPAQQQMPEYAGGAFNAPGNSGPITAGMPFGPGPGPEALSVPTANQVRPNGALTNMLERLAAGGQSPALNSLLQMAREHGV